MTGLSAPPMPRDAAEAARIEHQRMRRRVIYGMHHSDVVTRLVTALGTTRANAVRIVDMTANPAWYVCSQLAALHREIPEVTPPEGAEDTAAAVAEAGYWQLAQRVQRDTVALNDTFVRVDLDPDTNEPAFRLVPPDLVTVDFTPLAPSQPLALSEWIEDPELGWVQLRTNPRQRLYAAYDDKDRDVSEHVLGGARSGDNYPFIVEGRPVLPYVAYHAAESGYLMDPYTGREVFEGALQLGMYYSFFGHALRQASWAQRWAGNARPKGGGVDESGRRQDVVADPASLLLLESEEESTQPIQVGQWSPPVDPDRLYAALERYERRLVEMALSTVGVSRRESDVRSAMSLAVSREAQRDAQRAYEPVFRRSDLKLLSLVSGLRGEPTKGWRIEYKSLPRDSAELAAELELMQGQIAAGLLDKVTAYRRLHPGLTQAEAETAVKTIAEVNARMGAGAPTPAPSTPEPAPR